MSGILVKATLVPEKGCIFLGALPIVMLSLPNLELIESIASETFFLFLLYSLSLQLISSRKFVCWFSRGESSYSTTLIC